MHSTFRKALKHKESNVSSVPSPSETEDILPSSETSSLSSYPPFTSSISSFENECPHTKGIYFHKERKVSSIKSVSSIRNEEYDLPSKS